MAVRIDGCAMIRSSTLHTSSVCRITARLVKRGFVAGMMTNLFSGRDDAASVVSVSPNQQQGIALSIAPSL